MIKNSKEWRKAKVAKEQAVYDKRREAFAALVETHGKDPSDAVRSQIASLHEQYPTGEIPCKATLTDGTTVDPCLLVIGAICSHNGALCMEEDSLVKYQPSLLVGGQLQSVELSSFALPYAAIAAAFNTPELGKNTPGPAVVQTFSGERFLLEGASYFFQIGDRMGKDIDPSANFDHEDIGKLGVSTYGNSLKNQTTYVVVEI